MNDAALLASLDGWKFLNAMDVSNQRQPFMNVLPFAAREAVHEVTMAMQETPFPHHPVLDPCVFRALGCTVSDGAPLQRGLNCLAACPDDPELATAALCAIAIVARPEFNAVRLPNDTDVLEFVLRRVGPRNIRYKVVTTECICLWTTPCFAGSAHQLQTEINSFCALGAAAAVY